MSTTADITSPSAKQVPSFAERQQTYKKLLDALQTVLPSPEKQIILNGKELEKYRRDQSRYCAPEPIAAVLPTSTQQVAAVVRLCAQHKVAMTPRGAGTGIEGAALPFAGGIIIDTAGIQGMHFDTENSCAWVGAGVRKSALNKEAAKHGFIFGPDPASDPYVGGMVATSGSGMSTLRYGTTRENVLSLRVVTPAGKIIQTRKVVRKSSTGLELTQLYIGSEGTLGIICEICFRLFPITKYSAGGHASFDHLEDAVRAVVALKKEGVPMTLLRCELMNADAVRAANAYCTTALPVISTVLLEFTSNDATLGDIKRDYDTVARIFRDVGKAKQVRYMKPGKETDDLWNARRMCYYSAIRYKNRKNKLMSTDVCVPLTKLTEIVKFSEDLFVGANKPFFLCAHISDGNFHLVLPFTNAEEYDELIRLEHKMIERAIQLGGTVSGEHGVGAGKVCLVTKEHGQDHIDVQQSIKAALDNDNIMNPGVFYPFQYAMYPHPHL